MPSRRASTKLVLNEFLPYLLNRAGVKTGLIFSQDLAEFGVMLWDWRILIALWQNESQRLNEIADVTVGDLSTMSRQVRALEKSGLIVCKRSSTDRRALNLVLTPKGRKITAQIIPIAHMHASVATQGISEAELAIVRRCMTKIYHNLKAFDERRKTEFYER